MRNPSYLADHDLYDYPGGAEKVDYNIYSQLPNSQFWKISTKGQPPIEPNVTYILGNATFLNDQTKDLLIQHKNYIIFEHDYKIHPTRQPHRYYGHVFPKEELINLDLYANARAVFLQTNNHLEGFQANGIKANFINLSTSIWSNDELDTLARESTPCKADYRFCIIGNKTADKGSDIAIKFCQDNNLDFLILPTVSLHLFYAMMAKYPALVYFPRVRESFCRLVVEARCLRMNVITSKNYGAVCESWFSMQGPALIKFLRENTRKNLETIQKYI